MEHIPAFKCPLQLLGLTNVKEIKRSPRLDRRCHTSTGEKTGQRYLSTFLFNQRLLANDVRLKCRGPQGSAKEPVKLSVSCLPQI
jgi:hypothetical protein